MELVATSKIGISVLLVYISLTGAMSAFIFRSKMTLFMKSMWIAFVWMLPFLGSLAWLLIQSFDHKFQMDGGYRQELPS